MENQKDIAQDKNQDQQVQQQDEKFKDAIGFIDREEYYIKYVDQINYYWIMILMNMTNIDKAKKIFEAGCGAGYHLRFISSLKPTDCLYVATDISQRMLEAASFRLQKFTENQASHASEQLALKKFEKEEYFEKYKILLQQINAEDLSQYKNEEFDTYFTCMVLHHTDQMKLLTEAYRVLKQGGKIGIVEFGREGQGNSLWFNSRHGFGKELYEKYGITSCHHSLAQHHQGEIDHNMLQNQEIQQTSNQVQSQEGQKGHGHGHGHSHGHHKEHQQQQQQQGVVQQEENKHDEHHDHKHKILKKEDVIKLLQHFGFNKIVAWYQPIPLCEAYKLEYDMLLEDPKMKTALESFDSQKKAEFKKELQDRLEDLISKNEPIMSELLYVVAQK